MNKIVKTIVAAAVVLVLCSMMLCACSPSGKGLTDLCGVSQDNIVLVEYAMSGMLFAPSFEMDSAWISEFWQLIDVDYQRVDATLFPNSGAHIVTYNTSGRQRYISVSQQSDGRLLVDSGNRTYCSLQSVHIPVKFCDGLKWQNQGFTDNQLVVYLTNNVSNESLSRNYTPADFPEFNAVGVEDVNLDQLLHYRNDAEEAQANGQTLFITDYYRELLVTLDKHDKQNVLDCVDLLRTRSDILKVKPLLDNTQILPFVAHSIRDDYNLAYSQNGILVSSPEQLHNYFDAMGKDIQSERSSALQNAIQNYTNEFFQTHMLVVFGRVATSGSTRFTVTDVEVLEQSLVVSVCQSVPQIGTCDMAGWHIFVEIEKIQGITEVFIQESVNRNGFQSSLLSEEDVG